MDAIKKTMNHIQARLEKEWIGIPQKYSKLKNYIPFWEPKKYILVSANSGVGKTRHIISDFIVEPYKFSRSTNGKKQIKILYFSLEVEYHSVMGMIISNLYYDKFQQEITKQDLFTQKQSPDILENIEKLNKLYPDLDENITIIDTLHYPDEIMAYARKWYSQFGSIEIENGQKVFKRYPIHEDTQFVVIVDTINALYLRTGKDMYSTISEFSLKDCKGELVDFYNTTLVVVQQQDKETEKNAFTTRGERNEAATKPSRNSLAQCKRTFDDADIFYTLYSPYNYRIERYPFTDPIYYDIKALKDHFTLLLLEKNRDGDSPAELPLYSKLGVLHFSELPSAHQFTATPALYSQYAKKYK